MSDQLERRLRQLTPRGCDQQLRPQVLAMLADALLVVDGSDNEPSKDEATVLIASSARFSRLVMCSAAAFLAMAVAINVLVHRSMDHRLAVAFDPPMVRKQAADIATEVASVTDPQMGRWTYNRHSQSPPSATAIREHVARIHETYRHLAMGLQITAQDANRHEEN